MEKNFYDLLQEKANLTAWKYYEKDEMSENLYEKLIVRYSKSLPDAEEIVFDTKNKAALTDSLQNIIPKDYLVRLLKKETIRFRHEEKQSVGLYYADNQGNFVVIITAVDKFGIHQRQKLLEVMLLVFLGSFIFMFLIGRFYATNVLSPIVAILKNIRRIRATNLSLRLKEKPGNDELAELTRTFNQMLDRLENSFTLQKDFIHNASHELKNPLTAILGETEVALSKERTTEEYIITLNKIMAEAERLNQLTKNLLSLAQTDFDLSTFKKDEIRIDELIWDIKDHFDKSTYKGRIGIHFPVLPDSSDQITISGVKNLLQIAFVNLIENACKFSGQQKVDIVLNASQKDIQLQIVDRGIGIPEAEIGNLFQPFFRASNAITYKGSGIGLSLVHKIITMHGGTIAISSVSGKGTTVEIHFSI
jgi:signal transduction histidine kinase